MPGQRNDYDQLLTTLGRLKGRVQELDHSIESAAAGDPAADGQPLLVLQATLAALDASERPADVPGVFLRLAEQTGLRLVVFKRWRSGLQVVADHNISLPDEARQKLPSGRAPIPSREDDIFAVVARDRQIYAGPVPLKAFPTDLTLLMGRGTAERRVIIMPLPARDRWSTFLYLDGGADQALSLSLAEMAARHALGRMHLLAMGEGARGNEVDEVLQDELTRRRARRVQRPPGTPPSLGRREPLPPSPDAAVELDAEWLSQTPDPGPAEPAPLAQSEARDEVSGLDPQPLDLASEPPVADAVPRVARVASQARAEADAIVEAWEEALLGPAAASTVSDNERVVPPAPMAPADILHQSGDLPAMPKAALHILSVIDDPRTTATRLEKAVAMDQTLTAKILRIANSPFYGAVREIKTVSEAIVRLGFVTIRNWTLVTATKSVFLGVGATPLFHKIWRQSVLSAMAAQLASQALRKAEPETVFVGGLMQNIGQLVLARRHPELFQQVLRLSAEEQLPYYVVEQELLGFDHGDLGALLIKEWNLSEELEQAVRWHHRLDHPDVQYADLAALVALGEEIAACSGSTEEEDPSTDLSSLAAERLGVTPDLVSELRRRARDLSIDSSFFS